jgi:outer membrane immunogenic protein
MWKVLAGVIAVLACTIVGNLGQAGAADMAVKSPPPPLPTPVSAWTGCYFGIEGGGNWGQTHSNSIDPTRSPGAIHSPDHDLRGGLVGDTLGCNYQVANWVVGAEGDFSWTDQRGSAGTPPPFNTTFTITENEHWLATTRGRLGYAAGGWLVYATGGAAWARLDLTEADSAGPTNLTQSHTMWGGVVGGGLEWMFAPRWSAKAEFLYIAFQPANYFGVACCTLESRHLTDDIFRVGLNYQFSAGIPK